MGRQNSDAAAWPRLEDPALPQRRRVAVDPAGNRLRHRSATDEPRHAVCQRIADRACEIAVAGSAATFPATRLTACTTERNQALLALDSRPECPIAMHLAPLAASPWA